MKSLLSTLAVLAFFAALCGSIVIMASARATSPVEEAYAAPPPEQDERALLPQRTRLIDYRLVQNKNGVIDYSVAPDATKEEILTLAFTLRDELKMQNPQESMVLRIHAGEMQPRCACSVNYTHDIDFYYIQWGF